MVQTETEDVQVEPRSLFFSFEDRLKIYLIPEPTNTLNIGDEAFERTEGWDGHGFYDWLRTADGTVVGLRYDPAGDYSYVYDKVKLFDYVEIQSTNGENLWFLVFLGKDRIFDDARSADQLFFGDYFYRSTSGIFGLCVELPDEDLIPNGVTKT